MLGEVGAGGVALREVHRFGNHPVTVHGTLYWDVLSLWGGAIDGLRAAARGTAIIAGIGVDSWAIDYGLLDEDGRLLGNPVHYRDRRTEGIAEDVESVVAPEELYERTGVQVLALQHGVPVRRRT